MDEDIPEAVDEYDHETSVAGYDEAQPTQEDYEREPDRLLPMHPLNKPKRKTVTPQLASKERRLKALNLRMSGATYDEIAKAVGYASGATAGQAVRDELSKITTESAEQLRTIQYQRLNTMLLIIQPQVMSGDLRAIGQAQSLMRDMNALMGIAAEQMTEATATNNFLVVIDGAETEYVSKLKALAGVDPDSDSKLHGIATAVTVNDSTTETENHGDTTASEDVIEVDPID